MTILKIGFVGIRSDRLQETVALFRDVIGVPVTRQTNDLVGFRLADGTVLELYGPGDEFHAFFTTGPVVAFRVDDFDETRRAIEGSGGRVLSIPTDVTSQESVAALFDSTRRQFGRKRKVARLNGCWIVDHWVED